MKLTKILVAAIAPLITLVPQFTSIALAGPETVQVRGNRSNCNVPIVGSQRGSRVNMRSGPGTVFSSPSYVLVGQTVNMLNDMDSNRIRRVDPEGMEWYFVEYVPSNTRGWVRGDFIGPSCLS
jgi:SH3-like domain-containing protein